MGGDTAATKNPGESRGFLLAGGLFELDGFASLRRRPLLDQPESEEVLRPYAGQAPGAP
jgi:hypothetical protein